MREIKTPTIGWSFALVGHFVHTGTPIAALRASRGMVLDQPTYKKRRYQKRKILNHNAIKSVVVFLLQSKMVNNFQSTYIIKIFFVVGNTSITVSQCSSSYDSIRCFFTVVGARI